jgi:hypothetical protein
MTEHRRDQKVVFAFVPADRSEDGIPTLMFMMPEEAWRYMSKGLGHEFDLTNAGIPLRVLIGRSRNHATAMAELEKANGGKLKGFMDLRDANFKFDQKPKQ